MSTFKKEIKKKKKNLTLVPTDEDKDTLKSM